MVEVSSVENILKMLHKCCTQRGRVASEIENCTFVAHAREGRGKQKLHVAREGRGVEKLTMLVVV